MAPYQVRGCPGGEDEAAPPSDCLSESSAQPGSPQGCANRRVHRSLLNEQSSIQLLSRKSIISKLHNLTSDIFVTLCIRLFKETTITHATDYSLTFGYSFWSK